MYVISYVLVYDIKVLVYDIQLEVLKMSTLTSYMILVHHITLSFHTKIRYAYDIIIHTTHSMVFDI